MALAPSAAEILFALGAATRVVAVSDFARDLPEARGKSTAGGFTPDLERIVALAPDLVIASRDGTDRASFERLRGLGLRVEATEAETLEGVLGDIRRVGGWIGEPAAATALVERLLERIRAVDRLVAGSRALPRLRAAVVIWPDPLVLAGPRTFVGDVLVRAGFENAVPGGAGEWPRVSLETLAAWNPAVLVRPETAENREAFLRTLEHDPRWNVVAAARRRTIVVVPGAWLERPGPRLVDALELLARLPRSAP